MENKKRILIKVPGDKEKLFETFPFFIALKDEFQNSDIFIICEQGTSALFLFFSAHFVRVRITVLAGDAQAGIASQSEH